MILENLSRYENGNSGDKVFSDMGQLWLNGCKEICVNPLFSDGFSHTDQYIRAGLQLYR